MLSTTVPQPTAQMAHATSKCDTGKSGVRDRAGETNKVVEGRLVIDVASIGTRLDSNQLLLRVDPDRGHLGEVDHDGIVRHSVRRMAALSSHGDRNVVRPTVGHRCRDVPHTRSDDEAQWIRARV